MSFGAPLAFSLLAVGGFVIVLYILKVKRRRVTVPYLRLWESLVAETRTRSLFKRLKRLLSLLLQLLILAAIVLALARPSFDLKSVRKEHIVVILDASASMLAREEGDRLRFDLLRERVTELIENRSFEDEMMLVAAADRIEVLCPFNRSKLRLREALRRAAPTRRSLDAGRALAFAREICRDKPQPIILFVSDGGGGEVAELVAAEQHATLLAVGTPRDNVGIIQFAARKNRSLATDFVLAKVQNFGETERELDLELFLNGVRQKVISRKLAPGEVLQERFQLALDEGGTLRLHLDVEDALDLDDDAYAIVQPHRPRRIHLVTSDEQSAQPFLIAFQSMSEVVDPASAALTLAEYGQLTAEEKIVDITICLNTIPEQLSSVSHLILINPPLPDFLPAKETGEIAHPEVWDWDREHLLNRYLNYRDLALPKARRIELEGGTAIVQGYDGPLVSAFPLPGRKAIYIAFDMTSELFPFRLAFPMLLRNAVAWFEEEEDILLEASYPTGAVISPLRRVAGATVTATYAEGKGMETAEVPLQEGLFYFDRTEYPGPYGFRIGERDHATSVNLFDPRESNLSPPEVAEDESGAAGDRSLHFLNRELWVYLALLGLLLWGTEWGLYHRRITE